VRFHALAVLVRGRRRPAIPETLFARENKTGNPANIARHIS
jgi:hypothetical protein